MPLLIILACLAALLVLAGVLLIGDTPDFRPNRPSVSAPSWCPYAPPPGRLFLGGACVLSGVVLLVVVTVLLLT
jgi:hypothetical protein